MMVNHGLNNQKKKKKTSRTTHSVTVRLFFPAHVLAVVLILFGKLKLHYCRMTGLFVASPLHNAHDNVKVSSYTVPVKMKGEG